MAIVGLALLIVGIIFIVLYFKTNGENKRRTANVTGTCIKVEEKQTLSEDASSPGIMHYTFSYNVDGKEYTTKPIHSIPGDPQVGGQVTLRYDPKKPWDAGYDYKSDDKTRYILWIGIGLTILSIVLIIL